MRGTNPFGQVSASSAPSIQVQDENPTPAPASHPMWDRMHRAQLAAERQRALTQEAAREAKATQAAQQGIQGRFVTMACPSPSEQGRKDRIRGRKIWAFLCLGIAIPLCLAGIAAHPIGGLFTGAVVAAVALILIRLPEMFSGIGKSARTSGGKAV